MEEPQPTEHAGSTQILCSCGKRQYIGHGLSFIGSSSSRANGLDSFDSQSNLGEQMAKLGSEKMLKFVSEEAIGSEKQRHRPDDQMRSSGLPCAQDRESVTARPSSRSRMQSDILPKSLEAAKSISAREQVTKNDFNSLIFVLWWGG